MTNNKMDNNNSSMKQWSNWAAQGKEKEELFYEIYTLVEAMIKEKIPEYLAEYMLDIKTYIGGKSIDLPNVKREIVETL